MRINLKTHKLKSNEGVTLIELLIAMIISAILIAAIYHTFIRQQKTYTVQEQVVDMQQNVRVAINRMMREIRMAGFGNVSNVLTLPGGVNGFTNVITPGTDSITIVGGYRQILRDNVNRDPVTIDSDSGNQITLDFATDAFDGEKHKFISIGGIESNVVPSRTEATLTLGERNNPLKHSRGTPIYKIQAITYSLDTSSVKPALRRNENTDGGNQPLAENIEGLQFEYFDADGAQMNFPPDDPRNIRMINVKVTAKTDMPDPEFKGGQADGFRRRTITSNIKIRNIGQTP
jgi:prepilin-type N-terminal cleavage/methylation domain-containing protein